MKLVLAACRLASSAPTSPTASSAHGRQSLRAQIGSRPDDAMPDPARVLAPDQGGPNPHGLRHSHRTWMAEDGIPEILGEQRLGHDVPGMRGLYTHVSDAMRQDLTGTLEARWDTSLQARAAISPRSPLPLLDDSSPLSRQTAGRAHPHPGQPTGTCAHTCGQSQKKMISQIPPNKGGRARSRTINWSIRRSFAWSDGRMWEWA